MRKIAVGAVLGTVLVALAACGNGSNFTPASSSGASAVSAKPGAKAAQGCRSDVGLCPLPALPVNPIMPGYGPGFLTAAYGSVPSSAHGAVALIESGGDSTVVNDAYIYRNENQLGNCFVVALSGCHLHVYDGTGGTTNYPSPASDRVISETSADVDMVSAICPGCDIYVIQANLPDPALPGLSKPSEVFDQYMQGLEAAINGAIADHATVISISQGVPEGLASSAADIQLYANFFQSLPVPVVASTGDSGYDNYLGESSATPSVPADFPTVVSVGGTSSLMLSPHSEIAWADGGGGCSMYFSLPPNVQPINSCGSKRSTPDIAFFADPNPGVSIYYTSLSTGGEFASFGGTSVGAPAIAAYIAAAGGNASVLQTMYANYKANPQLFNDVTSGSTGPTCFAAPGFDCATGMGTPTGLASF